MHGGSRRQCPTFQDIVRGLRSSDSHNMATLVGTVQGFVNANENPFYSDNLKSSKSDSFQDLTKVLQQQSNSKIPHILLLLLQTFKILTRKEINRVNAGDEEIKTILEYLQASNSDLRSEAANILLNLCYERRNVEILIQHDGIPLLLDALGSTNPDIQANAAGAIQSICFQDIGREFLQNSMIISRFFHLLDSNDIKVQLRCMGALHNISSDAKSIILMRQTGKIPKIALMLNSPQTSIKGSAAGTLQNMSREVASRIIIQKLDVIEPLSELLLVEDLQARVCAAGALLNLVGPDSGPRAGDKEFLIRILSLVLSTSMIHEALDETGAECSCGQGQFMQQQL